ncbi:UNVERIFIED_CONTAM: Disease resistance protein RPP13 [Sesamum radiatum]|uniref:Disease resistance protein RPP13 n=1 Tax=Sesamum radiatum TaxID=300843 RepID=A0AAW2TEH8_SESRA
MAYASVVSLIQTLEQIIDGHEILYNKEQIECLLSKELYYILSGASTVIENFDSAKLQVMEFRNMGSKNLAPKNSFSAGSLRLASGGKNTMVGFVDEMLQIKDRLTGEPSHKLDVVSIVGMGGSGKTTLAKNIYDDAFIVYHFYTRAWVTISQEYHVHEILLGLLASMKKLTGKKM